MALVGAITISEVRLMGRKRRVVGTIVLGDGVANYRTGGIPLPAVSSFGFYRQMDTFCLIAGQSGPTSNFNPSWDSTTNKVQYFAETTVATNQPLIEVTDNVLAPAARTYQFEAWGW